MPQTRVKRKRAPQVKNSKPKEAIQPEEGEIFNLSEVSSSSEEEEGKTHAKKKNRYVVQKIWYLIVVEIVMEVIH